MRRLLTEEGAERDFLEKLALFRQNPGLLEQHWNDVGLEVLDMFMSRLFWSETPSPVSGANVRRMARKNDSDSDRLERRVDELWIIVEQLQQEVRDLRRQNSALQRQLEMQGEASRMASSVNRMDEVVKGCERRVKETEHKVDVMVRKQEFYGAKEGIIAHLARACGGNPHERGVIEATASSRHKYVPKDVTSDVEMEFDFACQSKENSWICYDFKGRSVIPTSYIIQSGDWAYPKSWALEVSNDGLEDSWVVVDSRQNNSDLNGTHVIREFGVRDKSLKAFRFVRLRQTGKNHRGDNHLCIALLEIFGTLMSIPPPVAGPGQFLFYDLRPLDGIIAHLTRECKGNVHEKEVVEVTASGLHRFPGGYVGYVGYQNGSEPKHAVDLEEISYFCSDDVATSWIRYDFKQKRVTPTSYSIKTSHRGPGGDHLKVWDFEGSKDGVLWQQLDHRDNSDLNDPDVVRNYPVTSEPCAPFRFLQIRQTGKNHAGGDVLIIAALEIFGTLSDEERPQERCES